MLAVSRFVLRHKGAVVVFWLAVLVAGGAASAKLSSRLSPQFALPSAASYQANRQILRLYGNGGNGNPEIAVVRLPPGRSASSPVTRQALGRAFTAVTSRLAGVRVADYASTGNRAFIGHDGRTTYGLVFTPYTGELSPPSLGLQITAAMTPHLPPGTTVAVTGMNELQSGGQAKEGFGVLAETLLAGAGALAVLVFVFGSALAVVPLLMAAVAIPAFGSLLLPVKAVLLNLASVAATYGVIVLIWQRGHGSHTIWGLPATGAITNWVPLIAFAFLYGLSMDYEVFILTRIREEHDRTHSTTTAVTEGIARTGRLVTGAALILFFAFAALSTGPETDLKVMATALGAGILLDATIVRALLVPALIALLGNWNWWLPRPAQRLLRVPAPPPPAQPATHATTGTRP